MKKYLTLFLLAIVSVACFAEDIPNVPPFYAFLLTQVHLSEPEYWLNYREQKEADKVVESIGWGAFRLDANTNELFAVFGPADPGTPPNILKWAKYHIECKIDQEGLVSKLIFLPGFKLPLTTSLAIGSPRIKAISYYGIPPRDTRTNKLEIFYYPQRQLTLTCSNNYVCQIEIDRPNHPARQSDTPIIPLKGWHQFRLGASQAELIDAFGPPDRGSTGTFLRWKRYNFYCLINPYYGVYILCFEPGFADPLVSGIALGSPAEDVLAKHGQPEAITHVGKVKRYIYSKQRLVFSIDAGRVSRILILPEQSLSQMHSLLREGSGWGAFHVGATREEIINAIGQPDNNPQANPLKWENLSLSCLFNEQGLAKEVRFGPKFHFPFNNDIATGATLNDVYQAYGRPSQYNHEKTLFSYLQQGVTFHINQNSKVDEIIITHKPVPTTITPNPNRTKKAP